MIVIDHVYKRYKDSAKDHPWILNGINLTIPPKVSVGLIGGNGAGKSTLLNLIGGIDFPNKGSVRRYCNVSWPMGFGGGLQGSLTGRENAKFVCRIHGESETMSERIAFIEDFADIGTAFDRPVKTYSSGMKSRLHFGMSLAFEFDVYISDEVTAVGDAAFNKKSKAAFKSLMHKSSVIMVSHQEHTLKDFCQAGIFLYQGQAHWFDQVDDALAAYHSVFKF